MKTPFIMACLLLATSWIHGQKVFKVKYESQADLKIYIVNYKSQAGWNKTEKQHLLL